MTIPQPGQKTIPLADWKRFLKVADWWDRVYGHRPPGALRPAYGHDVIVKTPAAGIDARVGDTISSATCTRCVLAETTTAGERDVHEDTDDEIVVYNMETAPIPGDIYIETGLTDKGARYAKFSGQILHGKLDGDLNSGSSATMSVWADDPLADTGDNVTIYDSSTLPFITAAYKIPSGRAVTATHKSGKWYLHTIAGCEVDQ